MSRNTHRLPELALAMILAWIGAPVATRAQQAQPGLDGLSQEDTKVRPSVSAPAPAGPLSQADIEALKAEGRAKGWTFKIGHNSATDRSLDELCGLIIPPDWEPPQVRGASATPRDELQGFFDWRVLRGTTLMKDQGACGSCWAFSAIGPIESAILIKEGVEVDLSEQWLMSCTDAGSCGGGWHEYALNMSLCSIEGAVLEQDFPYTAADVPCGGPYVYPYCIDDYVYVGDESLADVPYLKQAIFDYGPISVAVAADPAFQAYLGGVFNAHNPGWTNHAVGLVGWDDNQGENGVWIMRNSWGPDWGEYGYMRIEYGCSSIGYASFAVDYNPSDCNHNSVPDSQDFANCSGETWCDDCNANGLLDGCERDCNVNGIPDDCDIVSGSSPDVNADFLPDECETDCNGNGLFDFYELQDDLDLDIDRNLFPDECQDCDDDGIWDWEDLGRPDGLLVVSAGNGLVRVFYPDVGSAVGSYGVGHLQEPYDVVVGPQRHLYVSSSGDNRVVELDTLGNYVGDLNPCGTYPTGLAFGPDGNLYIASRDTNSVFRYDTTANACLGECIAPGVGGLFAPYNLTFDCQGHLFVSSSDYYRVIQYDLTWQFVRSFTLQTPRGLAFHPSGDLLVASYGNAQVLRFDIQTGGYVGVFSSLGAGPGAVQGLAYGPNGYLYVITYGGGVVRIYEVDGETGVSWRTFNRADPDLDTPAGLAFYPPSPEDSNHNYIPDDCEECLPSIAPLPEMFVAAKNRYLSIRPANAGGRTALRVTLTDLPEAFADFEGQKRWAGPPRELCENAGQDVPPAEGCGPAPGFETLTMWAAKLQCDPYYTDWDSLGTVHLYSDGIVPGGTYVVQAIHETCNETVEEDYSAPLTVTTSKWGDTVRDCTTCPCGPPEGVVNIPSDVTAGLDKFRNLGPPDTPCAAPIKARADVEPNCPDQLVNIADVTYLLDAFRGFDYPFDGPTACPPTR